MHSARNSSLSLIIIDSAKNTPRLRWKFSGKMWNREESIGFFKCSKYNRMDFCLNSQSTPRLITEMNEEFENRRAIMKTTGWPVINVFTLVK